MKLWEKMINMRMKKGKSIFENQVELILGW